MKDLILGIDIGGTYTDCAVIGLRDGTVSAKGKALTSKPDCSTGLLNSLSCLPETVRAHIGEVHVAGTVVTNAIIEAWMDRTCVALTEPVALRNLPHCMPVFFQNIFREDNSLCNLDAPLTREAVSCLFGEPRILVASLQENGIPREKALAAFLRQRLGSGTIRAACEWSNAENGEERLQDAYFSLALQPIVTRWFDNVAGALQRAGIDAPVRYVTGSGGLAEAAAIIETPLKSVMTGPVCSCLDSGFLTGMQDYLLVDIGVTITDITLVQQGRFRKVGNRVQIGDYRFGIDAAEMQSYGIGGDSLLWLNHRRKICAGPRQVASLSRLALHDPQIIGELETYTRPSGYEMLNSFDCDCFWASDQQAHSIELRHGDEEIIRYLRNTGAHSVWHLAEVFGRDPDAMDLFRLVKQGYLRAASLTPSDILCGCGRMSYGSRPAAEAAIRRMARDSGRTEEMVIQDAIRTVENQLAASCLQSTATFEQQSYVFSDSKAAWFLMEKLLEPQQQSNLKAEISLQVPLVAVGAAATWMQSVSEKLGTQVVIPRNHEVAGAVGAAVCRGESCYGLHPWH